MFDLILRAITHPRDYIGILSRRTLIFKEKVDEGNGCYSFIFTCTKKLNWRAGQHGIFTLPGKAVKGKQWRAFSIASSPTENEVRIGTSIPEVPSDFKQKLLQLQPGEEIHMRGPFGEFHLHNTQKQTVAIVGGIGVTPMRAIMFELAHDLHPEIQLDLIYAGKDNYFTYNDSCQQFSTHPNITINYVNTPAEVNAAIDVAVAKYQNQATYYISGSPGMIGAIKNLLRKAKIKKIINDPFKGY